MMTIGCNIICEVYETLISAQSLLLKAYCSSGFIAG